VTNDSRFDDCKSLTAYLVASGWIAEGADRNVECALSAFIQDERSRAIADARKAVNKALDKTR
jgi:hypothetical protein